MDYKEKYNEAFELIKPFYPGAQGEMKKQFEKVFPQLKESEDERIRKEIIVAIGHYLCASDLKNKCLAYLEKQKDAIGAARQQGYEEGLEDGIKMNMAEQIGESKEWADELSAEIDRISKRYPEVSFAKLSMVAVHFVRWQKEQKPTNSEKPKEWSEEDRKMLETICTIIRMAVPVESSAKEKIDWLKSRHPQPKAEWSEEDEKYLNLAINIVASDLGEDSPTVSWLKSLRPKPHWKPSEEDLTALEYCAEHTCPELLSLYLELKKL